MEVLRNFRQGLSSNPLEKDVQALTEMVKSMAGGIKLFVAEFDKLRAAHNKVAELVIELVKVENSRREPEQAGTTAASANT